MLQKIINPYWFILAIGVGFFFIYVFSPPPQVVIKFPNPYNAGKVVYHDKSDACYVYKAEKEACPLDKSLIKSQPLYT